MNTSLLAKIKDQFKLNIYEAKIWTALLSRGIASAAELAEISKVPRSRCYDVLESLEKKGYIIMKIGKPIKYIAQKPEVAMDRLRKDRELEAKEQLDMLELVSDDEVFTELDLLHKSGVKHVDISELSKSVVGRSAINKTIKSMIKGAQKSVVVVSDSSNLEKNLKPIKSVIPILKKKGISIEVFAPLDKRMAKKLAGASYTPYNAESSFVCIDGKEILFLVSSQGTVAEFEVALWLDSPFFVQAFTLLFRQGVKQ